MISDLVYEIVDPILEMDPERRKKMEEKLKQETSRFFC
jgi:hypothetical protein